MAHLEKRRALAAFFNRLEQRDEVSDDEKNVLVEAAGSFKLYPARTDMVREGDRLDVSTLIVQGWAARYRVTRSGERQTSCFHIAGDFIDLHAFPLKVMDHSIEAVSDCKVLEFPHRALREITERQPHLTRMLWLMTLLDGAIHRQWITAMGRLTAAKHMAHLLCEMFVRCEVAGVTDGNSFEFPVTQQGLADALGLSIVHTNRCVQELRRSGLISWEGSRVEILYLEELKRFAEFDATFLNFVREPR